MMQKVFEKSDIQQFLFENDNKGYVVTKGIGELFLFDLNTFEFHPCDLSGIYSLQKSEDYFFVTECPKPGNYNYYVKSISTGEVFTLPDKFSPAWIVYKNDWIIGFDELREEGLYNTPITLYNFKTCESKQLNHSMNGGFVEHENLITKDFKAGDSKYMQSINLETGKLDWEVDVRILGPYHDQIKGLDIDRYILEIFPYADNVIVQFKESLASYKVKDGSLNWYSKYTQPCYSPHKGIVKDNLYHNIASNPFYQCIDLDTGEILSEVSFPSELMMGSSYSFTNRPHSSPLLFGNQLLFLYNGFPHYCIFFDLFKKQIDHIDLLSLHASEDIIREPILSGNKMIVHDSGFTLHVFEVE